MTLGTTSSIPLVATTGDSPTDDGLSLSRDVLDKLQNDTPEAIKARLSEARQRDFHDNRRILVIDDVAETALRTSGHLSKLYAQVDCETDPVSAVKRINDMAQAGQPYDAIVLDLYMPAMTGIDLLAKLRPNTPAVVINTASMMAPAAANLQVEISTYVSTKAREIFEAADKAQQAAGLPTIAIHTHYKLDSLSTLVDKLDGAMLIRQFVPDRTEEFLAEFKPRLYEVAFTDKTLHLIAEDVRNMAEKMGQTLGSMRRQPGFADSAWWQTNGAGIEKACDALTKTRFSTLAGETPAHTLYNLHNLVNDLARLSPPSAEVFEPQIADALTVPLILWQAAWESSTDAIDSHYRELRKYFNGELDVGALMAELFPTAEILIPVPGQDEMYDRYGPTDRELNPNIQDPDRIVRTILTSAAQAFKNRIAAGDPGAIVQASLCPETYQVHDWIEEYAVRQFAEIHCGDYWKVLLFDNTGRPADDEYAALAPALVTLQRSGLGFFSLKESEGSCDFCIYIKVGEKTADYVTELDTIAEQKIKKADGSWIYRRGGRDGVDIEIQEDIGPNRDIISVGLPPDPNHVDSKPILCQIDGRKIWCDEGLHHSHYWSAGLLNEILCELRERQGDRDGAAAIRYNTEHTEQIYYESVRVVNLRGRMFLDLKPEKLKSHWAYQTLLEMGVDASRIEARPQAFLSR